jgi:hypothetical protein
MIVFVPFVCFCKKSGSGPFTGKALHYVFCFSVTGFAVTLFA